MRNHGNDRLQENAGAGKQCMARQVRDFLEWQDKHEGGTELPVLLQELVGQPTIDWDRANSNEQELLTYHFPDGSSLPIIEDTRGRYWEQEIGDAGTGPVDENDIEAFHRRFFRFTDRPRNIPGARLWLVLAVSMFILTGLLVVFGNELYPKELGSLGILGLLFLLIVFVTSPVWVGLGLIWSISTFSKR